ncbi:MAG: cell division protein FtsZ [Flavobacteriales bacterium]
MDDILMDFDLPKNQSSEIKIIGVGGGGSNAVNHLFNLGISEVNLAVCNTDAQALESSPVPTTIQLGEELTKGLGAGANPEVGAKAAQESLEAIRSFLDVKTQMLFITAGMGGGTGTGAAPIIARTAKEMNILSVAIVTVPFGFEGKPRMRQAMAGIDELKQHVDTLIVINNDKIRTMYGNLGFEEAFAKADNILATATKGITEVIVQPCLINIDLNDARTVLTKSGTAIMGRGLASGEGRAKLALERAIKSPLLNDSKIQGANKVLLLIMSGTESITIDEITLISDELREEIGDDIDLNLILGVGKDESQDDQISVTVIATGFKTVELGTPEPVKVEKPKVIIHDLEDERVKAPFGHQGIDETITEKTVLSSDNQANVSDSEQDSLDKIEEKLPETGQQTQLFSDEDTVAQPKPTALKPATSKRATEPLLEEHVKPVEDFDDESTEPSALNIIEPKACEETVEKAAEIPPFTDRKPSAAELAEIAKERLKRLQKYNSKTGSSKNLEVIEKESALKRQGIKLENIPNKEGISKRNLED